MKAHKTKLNDINQIETDNRPLWERRYELSLDARLAIAAATLSLLVFDKRQRRYS